MTMYLPNSAVRPTGYEAGEFLEIPERRERPGSDHPSDASTTTPPAPEPAAQPGQGETTRQVF